jgi:uncharacterized membrane protein
VYIHFYPLGENAERGKKTDVYVSELKMIGGHIMHKYHGLVFFGLMGIALIGFFLQKPFSYITLIALIIYAVLKFTVFKDEKKKDDQNGNPDQPQ